MEDFYEVMDRNAFDVDKAISEMKCETRTLPEIINEMLEEAGLDAVESVSAKPITSDYRRLHRAGDLRGDGDDVGIRAHGALYPRP